MLVIFQFSFSPSPQINLFFLGQKICQKVTQFSFFKRNILSQIIFLKKKIHIKETETVFLRRMLSHLCLLATILRVSLK